MVRSLEKLGLAKPARTHSKYRLYTNDDLRVLRRAIYLRRVQRLNAPAILNQLKQEGLSSIELPVSSKDNLNGPQFRKLRLRCGQLLRQRRQCGLGVHILSSET